MAGRMPEMRRKFLYRHAFLNSRTARFDLALAGVALSQALRSPWPVAAALPYARAVRAGASRARPVGPPTGVVATADAVADLVGLLAMLYGSARYRALVL
jgi:hypothetical protein